MSEFVKTDEQDEAGSEWDDVAKNAKWQELQNYRKKDAEHWADNTRIISSSFAKRIRELDQPMSKKEFEKWEDEYIDSRNKVKEAELRMSGDTRTNLAIEERINLGINPDNTIDALAGDYYNERISALRSAIEESNGNNDDIKKIEDFYKAVAKHIVYRTPIFHDKTDFNKIDLYQRERAAIHDEVIRCLNEINSMAEKYGARRLTPSDFYTSNLDNGQNGKAGESRFEFDRDVVETYYSRAFSGEVREAELRQKKEQGYGGR